MAESPMFRKIFSSKKLDQQKMDGAKNSIDSMQRGRQEKNFKASTASSSPIRWGQSHMWICHYQTVQQSYTTRAEATSAKKRFLRYKRFKTDLLSPNDYCLISHPEIIIINWKTRKKKQQLKILDNAHREWKKE